MGGDPIRINAYLDALSEFELDPLKVGVCSRHVVTFRSSAWAEYEVGLLSTPQDAALSYEPAGPNWTLPVVTVKPTRRRREVPVSRQLRHVSPPTQGLPRTAVVNLKVFGRPLPARAPDYENVENVTLNLAP
jgi:hypothetical protein